MDEIRELLNSLTQLSAEDLDRLRGLIVAKFDEVDKEPTTPENVALLNELADAGDTVQAEGTAREEAQAQAEADKQAARERIAKLNGNGDEEEAEETETPAAETEETPEAEGEETPEAESAETPDAETVTAAGRVRRMAARQGKPKPSPEAAADEERVSTALVASGESSRFPAGAELDREKLAIAMSDMLNRRLSQAPKGAPGARGRDVMVASASWAHQYPDDRRLSSNDWVHNDRLFKQTVSREALVATGGICAPVNVDWSINVLATAERPLRAALPSFQASRGGLIYRQDFDFAGYSGATGIWTEATDLSPAGATKPIYTVSCPGNDTAYVEAISTRLGFGNMQARFDPETMAAATDATNAAAARIAENNLLNLIAASATQSVTTTQVLGATRDLLTTLTETVAGFRSVHRVDDSVKLRAIFPSWVKDMIRADLARESAHQQDSQWNSLAVSDQQIEDLFAVYGVSPIWHIDGQSTAAPGLSGAVNQYFGAQSGSGAVNKFPTDVVWYLYYEGSLQLLDGGTLDLGVVRDSLLDSTNDFEVFQEIFETVIFRGFSGGLIQFISPFEALGTSAATVTVSSAA